jgi:hypothetical protein
MRTIVAMIVTALVGSAWGAPAPVAGAWEPERFADVRTLDFLTVGPEEGEHWSRVWLVVLDAEVYVRLGSRAAERMELNLSSPYVAVRIAGEEFPKVLAEPRPDMADRVADAMAEKYWTDVFVRGLAHPLTMRLVPEPTVRAVDVGD